MKSYKVGQRLEYKPTKEIFKIVKIIDETVCLTKEGDPLHVWYLDDIESLPVNYNII